MMPKKYFSRYAVLTCLALLATSGMAVAQSAFEDPGARTASGAAGDLKSVNDKTTSNVSLGASTQVVVLFKNEDSKPIKVNGVNLYPSSNVTATMGENQCADAPIMPGEICAATLQVKGLQAGNYRIEMLVRHDGRTKLLTATVDGAVESSGDNAQDVMGDIEVKPADIDFGTLTQSRIQLRPVVLRNITSQPVKIDDVTINAGENSGFTVDANCGELATGAACIATVKWVPHQPGPSSAMVVVNHNGPTRISTVALKGEYNPADSATAQFFPQAVPGKGLLVSSQEQIDFGSAVDQPSSITLSLVNSGDTPLKINSIRTTSTKNGVKIENNGCKAGTVLEPVQACPLTVTLNPSRTGSVVDDVQISHDGTRGILVIPVRGSVSAVSGGSGSFTGGVIGDDAFGNVAPLTMNDLTGDGSAASGAEAVQEKRNVLRDAINGYRITSFSKDRAILTKDDNGRIVYDDSKIYLNGVLVTVYIRKNMVEFHSGTEKAFLYFDGSFGGLSPDAITQTTNSLNPGLANLSSSETIDDASEPDLIGGADADTESEEGSTAFTVAPNAGGAPLIQ